MHEENSNIKFTQNILKTKLLFYGIDPQIYNTSVSRRLYVRQHTINTALIKLERKRTL